MRLAVATSAQLIDLQLDDGLRVVRETIVARGHHYGIALLPGPDNTVLSKHGLAMDRYSTRGDAPLQRNGRIALLGDVRTVHQIAYADGGVYVANTGGNSVIFQGVADDRFAELPLGQSDKHVNSVFPCGPGVMVMHHNKGRRPSEIVVVEHGADGRLRPRATIRLPHRGCHNVFLDGGRLLYNASEAGELVALDLVGRRVELVVPLDGHTKGLSVTADHVIVGCSPQVSGRLRFTSQGALVVLDRATLTVVARVELGQEGPVGNVNEVRALDGIEMGHAGQASLPRRFRSFRLPEPHSPRWRRVLGRCR